MGRPNLAFRYYMFEPDGTLKRASHRSLENLTNGTAALPQFIGLKLRYVEILLAIEHGQPVGIYDLQPGTWLINAAGGIQLPRPASDDELIQACEAVEALDRGARIVPLGPLIDFKRLQAPRAWALTDDELSQINRAIWAHMRPPKSSAPAFMRTVPVARRA